MYCRHCGTQLSEGARFCSNCCAPVGECTNMQMGFTPIQRGTPLSAPSKEKKSSVALIILLVFLCGFLMLAVPMGLIVAIGGSLYEEYGELAYDLTINVSDSQSNDYSRTVYHPGSDTNYIHHYLPSGKYTVTAKEWNNLMEVANAFLIISDNDVVEKNGILTYIGNGFTDIPTHSLKSADYSIQITIEPGEHIFVMFGDFVFQKIVEDSSK